VPEVKASVEPEIPAPIIERVISGQTCQACGTVNELGGLFCTTCGESLQSSEVLPEAPPTWPAPAPLSAPEPIPEPVSAPPVSPASAPEPAPVQMPEPVPVPAPEQVVQPATPALSKTGLSAAGFGPRLPALVGYLGGLLLIAGSFTPMMRFATAPVTTFISDAGMGPLFIGLGLGALLLVTLKWFRELQVLGAVTLFLTGYIFWRITSTFSGLGSTTAGSGLSLQWGWAVLVIGGVLLLSAQLVALRRS
jgi:hypothetical protein